MAEKQTKEPDSPEISAAPASLKLKSAALGKQWDLVAIFTAGLMVVGIIQGLILYRQTNLMDAQSRAWVGLNNVYSTKLMVGQTLGIQAVLKNSGGTPALGATECAASINVNVSEVTVSGIKKIMNKLDDCPQPLGVFYLLPNAEYVVDISRKPESMTQQIVNEVNEGRQTFIAMGRVNYSTPAGEVHHTTFCAVYRRDLGSFNACPYGNDAK